MSASPLSAPPPPPAAAADKTAEGENTEEAQDPLEPSDRVEKEQRGDEEEEEEEEEEHKRAEKKQKRKKRKEAAPPAALIKPAALHLVPVTDDQKKSLQYLLVASQQHKDGTAHCKVVVTRSIDGALAKLNKKKRKRGSGDWQQDATMGPFITGKEADRVRADINLGRRGARSKVDRLKQICEQNPLTDSEARPYYGFAKKFLAPSAAASVSLSSSA